MNVASGDTQSNDHSYDPSLSADGRFVAFESLATNWVAGDTNGASDIFVYDQQTSRIRQVSVASDGTPANGASTQPEISANGAYVVFSSLSSNLTLDENECRGYGDRCPSIFVHELQTGITQRISVAGDNMPGNAPSAAPSISTDGRYVAFVSAASNLAPGDTNNRDDIFVRDRETGQTERISIASDGTQANDWNDWPSVSADGRFVAFGSAATNLTADATGGIFVHGRELGTTEWLGEGFAPNLSPDGRWVAFLARDIDSGWIALFLYDRQTDTRLQISPIAESIHGRPGNDVSFSVDGRWIAFWAVDRDPVTGDQKAYTDVFVYDRQTGKTELVSIASDGTPAKGGSGKPHISADGRFVFFDSLASNLVADDTNDVGDIFMHDRLTGQTERVSVPFTK